MIGRHQWTLALVIEIVEEMVSPMKEKDLKGGHYHPLNL